MPHPLSPRAAVCWPGFALLLVAAAAATEADPTRVVQLAVANLEQRRQYAWEFRNLAGEVESRTVWKDTTPNFSSDQRQPVTTKTTVSTFSPTIRGEYLPDGWVLAESGFAQGPTVTAVINPAGVRVIKFNDGEWLPFAEFRSAYFRVLVGPNRMTPAKVEMKYTAAWAAFTSPRPHVLLPRLLRGAGRFRFEQDEIVGELGADSARLLLGGNGTPRQLAPDRFKGNVRLRVREGVLQECRIQLDYDVDLAKAEAPRVESLDILILLTMPSGEPRIVPEAARTLLANK